MLIRGLTMRRAVREIIEASKRAKVKPKPRFIVSREKKYMELRQKLYYADLDAKHWHD